LYVVDLPRWWSVTWPKTSRGSNGDYLLNGYSSSGLNSFSSSFNSQLSRLDLLSWLSLIFPVLSDWICSTVGVFTISLLLFFFHHFFLLSFVDRVSLLFLVSNLALPDYLRLSYCRRFSSWASSMYCSASA